MRHENLSFKVWDHGGQEKLRANRSMYFEETDAVIFVVDSNDQESMASVRENMGTMYIKDSVDCDSEIHK